MGSGFRILGSGYLAAAITAGFALPSCHAPTPAPRPAAPRFRDAAAEAGVDFRHVNGASSRKRFVEIMGAGAAVFDYDNDGWSDLLLVNGRPLSGKPDPGGVPSGRPRLYRNIGGGFQFRDVTREAGLGASLYGMGCAAADFDNDGWTDLYVSAVLDPGRLFRNRGGGRFEDVTARAGVGNAGRWGSGCAWLDYDRDGRPDLYVASYVRYTSLADDVPCTVREGRRSYCIPTAYEGASGTLYRNLGGGRFADVTAQAGLQDPKQKALGVLAADLDHDGWTDLLVANDTVPNRVFRNRNGRFEEIAAAAGLAFGPSGKARAGMGIDLADWRNDGSRSVTVTNFARESIAFFEPVRGQLSWADESERRGVAAPSAPLLGFGIRFLDWDNDGYQDLCAVNGHVRDDVAELEPGQSFAQPALLLRNQGGERFEDVSAAAGAPITTPAVRRGLAAGDLDNDGRLDLVVTRNGGPAELWRNETEARAHWLAVRLVGRPSNRDAIGAWVEVRAGGVVRTRDAASGGGYLSDSDRRLHFGLGRAARVDEITVHWPGGSAQRFPACAADQVLTLAEEPGR